ncbi:U4 U6.U5 tri-snRNP-associated protein [Coemansia erecta]|uniref:U4 U6.U5 tri-snRNP-associated protein n=1 Tax=Coemansia erecta TaxID=147472 RepID=A0A9W7XWV8_9FUNG|nr:U4 U6.U5 tri-snRNP-associated protein [Coemansia erecta]
MTLARKRHAVYGNDDTGNDYEDTPSPAKARRVDIPATIDNSDPSGSDYDSDNDSEIISTRIEGIYLDTVNRANLDFDFEHICSVSLSTNNVYACLVCGKYYQGRGKQTHAYLHSINDDHHVFVNLQTLKIYVLPDNYEVEERSLNDIKATIRPTFTSAQVERLDLACEHAQDLSGKPYLAGFVGLNRVKRNDYMNVVFQALAHVPPIRDTLLLLSDMDKQTPLVQRLCGLVRKIWHPKLFKAHASPHELVQEVGVRSKRRFRFDIPGDAFDFLTWLLNTLHIDLGGTRKRNSSVVYRTFQGELQITAQPLVDTKSRPNENDPIEIDSHNDSVKVSKTPFLTLSLDLPPKPLFTDDGGDDDDNDDRSTIPQVALVTLLQRYNGSTVAEWKGEARSYKLLTLPRYIICHIRRFSKSGLSIEKNPTVVNYPIRNVPFGDLLPKDTTVLPKDSSATYDLISNICHDGRPEQLPQNPNHHNDGLAQSAVYAADDSSSADGRYLVYTHNLADDKWYMMRDLQVEPIMPQMIFLSDSYIQIWRRNGC